MYIFGPNYNGELRRESFRFYRVGLLWKTVPRETAPCAFRTQISLFSVHINYYLVLFTRSSFPRTSFNWVTWKCTEKANLGLSPHFELMARKYKKLIAFMYVQTVGLLSVSLRPLSFFARLTAVFVACCSNVLWRLPSSRLWQQRALLAQKADRLRYLCRERKSDRLEPRA